MAEPSIQSALPFACQMVYKVGVEGLDSSQPVTWQDLTAKGRVDDGVLRST